MCKFFLTSSIFLLFAVPLFAQGLTPKSPKIVESVNRAAEYLKQNGMKEDRLGGRALAAMALVKAGVEPDHPFIVGTISDIKNTVGADGNVSISDHIYTAGIVVLFLSDLDLELYRRELDAYSQFLLRNQRTDGAWTYLNYGTADLYPNGDMSMTQYGVMALWSLQRLGINVSGESVDRVGRWLKLVQYPDGSYSYHTNIAADGKTLDRSGPTLSMTAAGMASVYVCYDLMGYNGNAAFAVFDDTTPAGFSIVEEEPEVLSSDGFRHTINKSDLTTLQERGNKWLEQHFSPSSSSSYFYYYLYAFERYAAFRELAENKHQASPGWYNRVANNLLETQKEDGSWSGSLGAVVDTAYSILFLTRSTARTFQKIRDKRYGGGNMRGGRGLPKLTDLLKIEDGQVVSLSEMGDSSQLMDQLTRLEGTDDEALAQLADLPASDVEQLLQKNKTQIKRLVGHENAEQRFAAVQLFAKSGDVTNAPVLIYALTDPNPDIAQAALDALNRLARNPASEKIPPEENDRARLVDRWKEWFREIDPNAMFENR